MLAESLLESKVTREALRKNGGYTVSTRVGAGDGGRGLTERRALNVTRMSASALRDTPAPDRNIELRASILAIAQRHHRCGAEMIYLIPVVSQR